MAAMDAIPRPRLVLVGRDPLVTPRPPGAVRRYQLARLRVRELRGPEALHAHLARIYD